MVIAGRSDCPKILTLHRLTVRVVYTPTRHTHTVTQLHLVVMMMVLLCGPELLIILTCQPMVS